MLPLLKASGRFIIAPSLLHLCEVWNSNKTFFVVVFFGEMIYVIMWNVVSVGCIDFHRASAMEIVINLLMLLFFLPLRLPFDWNANASLHMKLTARATHNKQISLVLKAKAIEIPSPSRTAQLFSTLFCFPRFCILEKKNCFIGGNIRYFPSTIT